MKLGCKIMNGEEDLWCNIMRSKYRVENNIGTLQAKSVDSNLWKAILKTFSNLVDLGIWRIGDGNSIMPWNQSWIERGLILEDLIGHIPEEMSSIKINA